MLFLRLPGFPLLFVRHALLISWLKLKPSPVPEPVGLICKEWLKYFPFYLLRNALPLSATRISAILLLIFRCCRNFCIIPFTFRLLPFIHCIKRVVVQIQQHPANILRHDIDVADGCIKLRFISRIECICL